MPRNFRAGGTEGRPKGRDEWRTPLDLFEALDEEFRFRLDVACTSKNKLTPLGMCRDEGMDALKDPWPDGPAWMNPPYSGQGGVRPWLERAVLQTTEATVCLVSADTSTRWWFEVVARHALEVRFVVGRLRFRTPDGDDHYTKRKGGGLTTPSAIVVFGHPMDPTPITYSYINRQGRPA